MVCVFSGILHSLEGLSVIPGEDRGYDFIHKNAIILGRVMKYSSTKSADELVTAAICELELVVAPAGCTDERTGMCIYSFVTLRRAQKTCD